jgi:hypothetical protein
MTFWDEDKFALLLDGENNGMTRTIKIGLMESSKHLSHERDSWNNVSLPNQGPSDLMVEGVDGGQR